MKKENRKKAQSGQSDHDAVFQRTFSDLEDRLHDDRKHGGLEAEEERLHESDFAVRSIKPAQHHQADVTRQDEQRTCDQAARNSMQQPADVDGELLSLGSRQQHAIVERVKETRFADPALLLDEDAVHHCDLSRRTAEA